MRLRWEKDGGNTETAYSGELPIGAIGTLNADPSRWWYNATLAVFMRHIAKGHGQVASRQAARRAVEGAWANWLELARLEPAEGAPEALEKWGDAE